MIRAWLFASLAVLCAVAPAEAQSRAGQTAPARPRPGAASAVQIRGFGEIGATTFAAKQSFDTVLGSSTGVVFGGGVEVAFSRSWFAGVRIARYAAEGERVFVFEGETFDLGIPTRVRIVPVVLTAGYRFGSGLRLPLTPYVGAGIGWHQYQETSDFADDEENVSESFTGYHLFGGVEYRVHRFIAVAGEAEWSRVPDALGNDPNGVSAAFGERDLGGASVRVKVVLFR